MPLIERYVFRRVTSVFLLTSGAFLAALWMTQVLRELDVVTAKGQAIWVFLLVTVLGLPALLQVIAPIAYLIATILTLSSLNNDSELAAISAAGASRKAVNRPILGLGVAVMILVALSHHVLAPASLAALRSLVTRVGADVIATVVKDGGFRRIEKGLTIHIRERAADGSFHGIFVSDQRSAAESLDYVAARGMLVNRAGGSFLVLQNGHLIRENQAKGSNNVIEFEAYALDLSQLTAANVVPAFRTRERSSLDLLRPEFNGSVAPEFSDRVRLELHERTTSPLYALAFGLVALAFLGRPRTSRQDRTFAVGSVVLICLLLRAAGLAAAAAGRGSMMVVPLLYAIPLLAISLGAWATYRDARLKTPDAFQLGWDYLGRLAGRLLGRAPAQQAAAAGEASR